jgi:hypothetical protein
MKTRSIPTRGRDGGSPYDLLVLNAAMLAFGAVVAVGFAMVGLSMLLKPTA